MDGAGKDKRTAEQDGLSRDVSAQTSIAVLLLYVEIM